MTESRLHDLLSELVTDVDGPPLARAAWEGARRVRRRRRAAAVAAAGVLVIATVSGLAAGLGRTARPVAPPASTTGTPLGEPRITTAPARDAVKQLPQRETPLAALSTAPETAPAVAGSPVPRVVAALQRPGGPVLVLAGDGSWRRVGAQTREAEARLRVGEIEPGGTRLALVDGDAIVIVDVTTGTTRRLAIPSRLRGGLELVRWLPGGRVVIDGDLGAAEISVADGRSTAVSYSADEVVGGRTAAGGRWTGLAGKTELISRTATGPETRRQYGFGTGLAVADWYGSAWSNGLRIARTLFEAGDAEQAVAVIDGTDARVTDLLWLPIGGPGPSRSNGCCATLGWLDAQTVLLRDGGRLLAWRPGQPSRDLSTVARLPGSSDTGADAGYDIALALAPLEPVQ